MRPDELLVALAHSLDGFSTMELIDLLGLAAEEITRRDTCAGNYIARGRFALLQAMAGRQTHEWLC